MDRGYFLKSYKVITILNYKQDLSAIDTPGNRWYTDIWLYLPNSKAGITVHHTWLGIFPPICIKSPQVCVLMLPIPHHNEKRASSAHVEDMFKQTHDRITIVCIITLHHFNSTESCAVFSPSFQSMLTCIYLGLCWWW